MRRAPWRLPPTPRDAPPTAVSSALCSGVSSDAPPSELDLEDTAEVAVSRIVVAVEPVGDGADLRIVSFVVRPGLQVAADERDRRAHPATPGESRQKPLRQLIAHRHLADLHEAARFH